MFVGKKLKKKGKEMKINETLWRLKNNDFAWRDEKRILIFERNEHTRQINSIQEQYERQHYFKNDSREIKK
jgi:hypothetical protein